MMIMAPLGMSDDAMHDLARKTYAEVLALGTGGSHYDRVQIYRSALSLVPAADRQEFAQQLVTAGARTSEVSLALEYATSGYPEDRKRRVLWIIGGLVATGALGVTAFFLLRKKRRR